MTSEATTPVTDLDKAVELAAGNLKLRLHDHDKGRSPIEDMLESERLYVPAEHLRTLLSALSAKSAELEKAREGLEEVRDWLRYEVPAGTLGATIMLKTVNQALGETND